MRVLNLNQTADFLEAATINNTIDLGHAIIHMGFNAAGLRFVLVNDCNGESALTESL
jgi:hypothetical protein